MKKKYQANIGGKYHPQRQEAVEIFYKTIQSFSNESYTNSMFNGDEE